MLNKDIYFLSLAMQVKTASKCLRAKYGAVIVSADGRIVSTGYNGKPRGSINDKVCYRLDLQANAAKPNCCLHSEANALMFCSPEERKGGTIYISGIPCTDCALLIEQSGLARAVFLMNGNSSHVGNTTQEFIAKYGFKVQFVPYIISVIDPSDYSSEDVVATETVLYKGDW